MKPEQDDAEWQWVEEELENKLADEYVDMLYEEIEHEIEKKNQPSVFKWLFVFALGWWFGAG